MFGSWKSFFAKNVFWHLVDKWTLDKKYIMILANHSRKTPMILLSFLCNVFSKIAGALSCWFTSITFFILLLPYSLIIFTLYVQFFRAFIRIVRLLLISLINGVTNFFLYIYMSKKIKKWVEHWITITLKLNILKHLSTLIWIRVPIRSCSHFLSTIKKFCKGH